MQPPSFLRPSPGEVAQQTPPQIKEPSENPQGLAGFAPIPTPRPTVGGSRSSRNALVLQPHIEIPVGTAQVPPEKEIGGGIHLLEKLT